MRRRRPTFQDFSLILLPDTSEHQIPSPSAPSLAPRGFFAFWGSKSYAFTRTGTSASAVSQWGGRGASGVPGKSGPPPAPRQGVLGPASWVRLARAAPASGPPSCRHGERRQQRHDRSPRRKTQQQHKPGWRRKQFESGTYRFSSWVCRGSRRESLAMAGNLSGAGRQLVAQPEAQQRPDLLFRVLAGDLAADGGVEVLGGRAGRLAGHGEAVA